MTDLRPTDRLFFALYPTSEAATRAISIAEAAAAELNPRGRTVPPDRLHVTVAHVGDYVGLAPDLLDAAISAGDRVEAAPVDVAFGFARTFDRKSNAPFVLCGPDGDNAPAAALAAAVRAELARVGLSRRALPYVPHMTLFHVDANVDPRAVDPVFWTSTEIALVRKYLGQSRHEVIKTWPLRTLI